MTYKFYDIAHKLIETNKHTPNNIDLDKLIQYCKETGIFKPSSDDEVLKQYNVGKLMKSIIDNIGFGVMSHDNLNDILKLKLFDLVDWAIHHLKTPPINKEIFDKFIEMITLITEEQIPLITKIGLANIEYALEQNEPWYHFLSDGLDSIKYLIKTMMNCPGVNPESSIKHAIDNNHHQIAFTLIDNYSPDKEALGKEFVQKILQKCHYLVSAYCRQEYANQNDSYIPNDVIPLINLFMVDISDNINQHNTLQAPPTIEALGNITNNGNNVSDLTYGGIE